MSRTHSCGAESAAGRCLLVRSSGPGPDSELRSRIARTPMHAQGSRLVTALRADTIEACAWLSRFLRTLLAKLTDVCGSFLNGWKLLPAELVMLCAVAVGAMTRAGDPPSLRPPQPQTHELLIAVGAELRPVFGLTGRAGNPAENVPAFPLKIEGKIT